MNDRNQPIQLIGHQVNDAGAGLVTIPQRVGRTRLVFTPVLSTAWNIYWRDEVNTNLLIQAVSAGGPYILDIENYGSAVEQKILLRNTGGGANFIGVLEVIKGY